VQVYKISEMVVQIIFGHVARVGPPVRDILVDLDERRLDTIVEDRVLRCPK